MTYPLVNVYITDGKITMFNGKTHYKWPCSIAMLNYQRVSHLPLALSLSGRRIVGRRTKRRTQAGDSAGTALLRQIPWRPLALW